MADCSVRDQRPYRAEAGPPSHRLRPHDQAPHRSASSPRRSQTAPLRSVQDNSSPLTGINDVLPIKVLHGSVSPRVDDRSPLTTDGKTLPRRMRLMSGLSLDILSPTSMNAPNFPFWTGTEDPMSPATTPASPDVLPPDTAPPRLENEYNTLSSFHRRSKYDSGLDVHTRTPVKPAKAPVSLHKSWSSEFSDHREWQTRSSQPGPQPVKAKHNADMTVVNGNESRRGIGDHNSTPLAYKHSSNNETYGTYVETPRSRSFSHSERRPERRPEPERRVANPSPTSPGSTPNWKYGDMIYAELNGGVCFDLYDCNGDLDADEQDSGGDDLDGYSPRSWSKQSPRSDIDNAHHRFMSDRISRSSREQTRQLDVTQRKNPLQKVHSAPIEFVVDASDHMSLRKSSSQSIKAHLTAISDNISALVRRRSSLPIKKTSSSSSTGSVNSSSGFSSTQNSEGKHEPSTPPVDADVDDTIFHNSKGRFRPRSNSVPSILDVDCDSDTDKDDHGFLNHPNFRLRVHSMCSPGFSAMRKTPAGGVGSKAVSAVLSSPMGTSSRGILPKRWRRTKTPSAAKANATWRPEGALCSWSNQTGSCVTLQPTTLMQLTDTERVCLQKLALAKLTAVNLGCPITLPKEWCHKRSKRSGFSLKRRTGSSSLLENLREKAGKENKDSGGAVFGIPLGKVIANDLELKRSRPSMLRERRESADVPQGSRNTRKSSSSSGSDSLSEIEPRGGGSNLLDALSLSSSAQLPETQAKSDRERSLILHSAKVPYIVTTCCKHLETYGLHVLGIFRIGSSKKRSKQLRDEFNSGRYIQLNEEHNPHDVGALLKEFFRDLSDPLLTRDLYSGFIASRKMATLEERLRVLHHLISLLPPCNRDTLWMLLRFLHLVSQHSSDTVDHNGQQLPGNKMDTHNLATLFGPNLLHKAKGGEFQVVSQERADERKDVIEIIKEMINHHDTVFQLSAESHHEVLKVLHESDPEASDYLLDRKLSLTNSTVQRMEVDVDSCSPPNLGAPISQSSMLSVPTTQAISVDVGSPPSSHNDNVFLPTTHDMPSKSQSQFVSASGLHPITRRLSDRQCGPSESGDNLLRVPNQNWQRTPSPNSPRVSPRPKAFKAATPDLRIRVTPTVSASPNSSPAGMGHRPNRLYSKSLTSASPARTSTVTSSTSCNKHLLSVPAPKTKDSGSISSLSSGYIPGSSRSGTNSPSIPDPLLSSHQSWYLETPPDSPHRKQAQEDIFQREASPHPTSSKQRPLGIQMSAPPGGAAEGKNIHWQQDNSWQHWEKIASDRGDDFHEQETLV